MHHRWRWRAGALHSCGNQLLLQLCRSCWLSMLGPGHGKGFTNLAPAVDAVQPLGKLESEPTVPSRLVGRSGQQTGQRMGKLRISWSRLQALLQGESRLPPLPVQQQHGDAATVPWAMLWMLGEQCLELRQRLCLHDG